MCIVTISVSDTHTIVFLVIMPLVFRHTEVIHHGTNMLKYEWLLHCKSFARWIKIIVICYKFIYTYGKLGKHNPSMNTDKHLFYAYYVALILLHCYSSVNPEVWSYIENLQTLKAFNQDINHPLHLSVTWLDISPWEWCCNWVHQYQANNTIVNSSQPCVDRLMYWVRS